MKKRNVSFYLTIIGFLYVVLGFTIGINAYFIPFVQDAFTITTTASYLIMTATFSAYVLFATPAEYSIRKFGYRNSICISFVILALGFCLIAYSATVVSFQLFLFALFVLGIAQTLLTDAINSYVTILGPTESAARRISMMGIADKLALAGASIILALFLDLQNVVLANAIYPFYVIAVVILILGVFVYFSPLPELTAVGEEVDDESPDEQVYGNSKKSVFEMPHLYLGVLAIFFDVGVEMIALGSINDYAKVLGKIHPEYYVWLTTLGMVLGYSLGIGLIPKKISQKQGLAMSSSMGILTVLLIILVPEYLSIYLVALLGFANSLLWPTIFPLALTDLGKFTKKGASLLIMGIIGGAILPLVFGYIVDAFSYQQAYIVCLPAYAYILFYALKGSQIRT